MQIFRILCKVRELLHWFVFGDSKGNLKSIHFQKSFRNAAVTYCLFFQGRNTTTNSLPILALKEMSSKRCLITSTAFHSHYSHTNCMNYLSTCWVGIVYSLISLGYFLLVLTMKQQLNASAFKRLRSSYDEKDAQSDRIVCRILLLSHVDMLSPLSGCVL